MDETVLSFKNEKTKPSCYLKKKRNTILVPKSKSHLRAAMVEDSVKEKIQIEK